MLVLYVHHTAQSIRVGGLIGWVADATRDEVDRLYPAAPEPEDDPTVVVAPDYGIVTKLPHHVLLDIAEKADCVLELVPAMGDYVPRGRPLFHVLGSLPEPHRSAAALSVILDRERSHEFEPAFGLRKLVDVATRSIYSSPFQDPTRPPPCRRSTPSTTSSGGSPGVSFPPDATTMPTATCGSSNG